MSWKQGVCYCLRVATWNGGRGFSSRCFALRVLHSDFVYVGTFSTLLTTAEEDNTGFMALCAERMRRPSSWHPVWIQKVLHMALICVGMCFRIGSKTTNIKKHLFAVVRRQSVFVCVCAPGVCLPRDVCARWDGRLWFCAWGNSAACGPPSLWQGYKCGLGIFDGENERRETPTRK